MRRPPVRRLGCARFVGMLVMCLALSVAGCRQPRATRAECTAILNRIIEVELHERGFRDPALARLKREQLQRSFAAEVTACEGRVLSPDAMTCVQRATTTEQLSHQCLR